MKYISLLMPNLQVGPIFCEQTLLDVKIAAAAKSLQSCPTLWDPIDGSPPGSPVPGILQVKTLGWVAISFSNAWKWKVKVKSFSRVWLVATPWTAAHQAPLSMGFSRQEYWSGVPSPSPVKIANLFQLIWVRVWRTVFLQTFPVTWFVSLHIRVVNRIQFLEILGLKWPFPCWLYSLRVIPSF